MLEDALFPADVPFPVETNFLHLTYKENVGETPSPLSNIASMLAMFGPMLDYEYELKHHPLLDARQSSVYLRAALESGGMLQNAPKIFQRF